MTSPGYTSSNASAAVQEQLRRVVIQEIQEQQKKAALSSSPSTTPMPRKAVHDAMKRGTNAKDVVDEEIAAARASGSSESGSSAIEPSRIWHYGSATAMQFVGWCAVLSVLRFVLPIPSPLSTLSRIPVALLFLFLSFRSRVLSPLDNRRPTVESESEAARRRIRPSWTPPPLAFPLIWSAVGALRTASSVLVIEATRSLVSPPVLALLAHLCIGDTWNNINNVEKEYELAVPAVLLVLASAVMATACYWRATSAAGILLLPSVLWIGVAAKLISDIQALRLKYASSEGDVL